MKIVRVVLSLFLGAVSTAVVFLAWLWLGVPWSQPGSVSIIVVYGITAGIWIVSTLLIGYGAHHISAVFVRACVLGVVEWLTLVLIRTDLLGGGSILGLTFWGEARSVSIIFPALDSSGPFQGALALF